MSKQSELFDKVWIPCEIAMFVGFIMAIWGNGWWFAITLPALMIAIVTAVVLTKKEQKESTE